MPETKDLAANNEVQRSDYSQHRKDGDTRRDLKRQATQNPQAHEKTKGVVAGVGQDSVGRQATAKDDLEAIDTRTRPDNHAIVNADVIEVKEKYLIQKRRQHRVDSANSDEASGIGDG